jgi:hypothetical protein
MDLPRHRRLESDTQASKIHTDINDLEKIDQRVKNGIQSIK